MVESGLAHSGALPRRRQGRPQTPPRMPIPGRIGPTDPRLHPRPGLPARPAGGAPALSPVRLPPHGRDVPAACRVRRQERHGLAACAPAWRQNGIISTKQCSSRPKGPACSASRLMTKSAFCHQLDRTNAAAGERYGNLERTAPRDQRDHHQSPHVKPLLLRRQGRLLQIDTRIVHPASKHSSCP
jgi:hypothetical protein